MTHVGNRQQAGTEGSGMIEAWQANGLAGWTGPWTARDQRRISLMMAGLAAASALLSMLIVLVVPN